MKTIMNVLKGMALTLMFVGFFMIAGILGGITEFNLPLSNAWWIIPLGIVSIICAILGGLIKVEIERIEDENAD